MRAQKPSKTGRPTRSVSPTAQGSSTKAATPAPNTVVSAQKRARLAAAARDRTLREWQRQDVPAQEKAWKGAAKDMAQLMPGVMETMRLDQRRHESKILELWPNVVDPQIAQHCRPDGLARGTLFVSVDSSAWLDEIVRYRRHEILERVQLALGRDIIKKISFRIG